MSTRPRRSPEREKTVDLQPIEKAVLGPKAFEDVQELCLCPGCPAYPEADRGKKKAYCMRGDSAHKRDIEPKDCFCESCEIYKHSKLYGRNFFCLTGIALTEGMKRLGEGNPATKLLEERAHGPAIVVDAGLGVRRPLDEG